MKQSKSFTPKRIRAIRKNLNLSQEEAGRLLGGGPRAFTKYEAGTLKPSAAVINLFRILEVNPDTLSILKGDGPSGDHSSTPFEVTGAEITSLNPESMPELLRRLLIAEAKEFNLPIDGISVPNNINAPDGGEDGRISWHTGFERTRFLPFRYCQFQLKAGKISPSQAAKDVVTRKGYVKPMVRSVLKNGGHYIMLCTQRYNQQLVEKRQRAICNVLSEAGLADVDHRVSFWEADKIAVWVNFHPSVALWIREKARIGTLGGFATWNHWSGQSEHSVTWVDDPRLGKLGEKLQSMVTKPQATLRVVGLSGIGKSRLCLEALNMLDEVSGRPLRDFVMYAVQPEVGPHAIIPIVKKLALSGGRAIVVVDDCDLQTHAKLDRIVFRSDCHLSLITIHNEIPERINANTIKIDNAPTTVIKSIVDHVAKTMSSVDRDRLARLSEGFPEVAIRIARGPDVGQHLTDPVDDNFIDKFVCGRSSTENKQLLQSAQLFAVFGTIRIESAEKGHHAAGKEPSSGDHLTKIAELSHQLNSDDLYKLIEGHKGLVERGIVKRRGRFRTVEPRSIAVRLAERQWKDWSQEEWDRVLTGDIGSDLNVSAARRLAELNTTKIAQSVVRHMCRTDGLFDQVNSIDLPGRAEVLSALAEINPYAVAECTKRSLDRLDDLRLLGENVRSILVRMSSKIAFHSETFKIGARLLLQLEVAKQPSWPPDVSCAFAELFSPVLGGTKADGKTRLLFLDELIHEACETSDLAQLKFVVDALDEGSTIMDKYFRMLGPEIQGSRRALDSWHPISKQEWSTYIAGCVDRLRKLAIRNDDVGEKARSDLGHSISSLVHRGFLEEVEKIVSMVIRKGHSRTMILRQLKARLAAKSSRMDEYTSQRIRSLIKKLESTNLRERIYLQVTEPPMRELGDEKRSAEEDFEHRRVIARALADELLQNPQTLTEILPELSRRRQFMADELGKSLAECAKSPITLLRPIVEAIEGVPPEIDRNYDLLVGFITGLPEKFRDKVEEFKKNAIESSKLAPAVPIICRRAGLTPGDIDRAIDALNRGVLAPRDLHHWAYTWVLEEVPHYKVALLLDAMLDHSAPSFALAVTILGRILYNEDDENNKKKRSKPYVLKLADFRPQLLKMVQDVGRWSGPKSKSSPRVEKCGISRDVIEYHFEAIVLRMLARGRKDSDARKTALKLAQTLVHGHHSDLLYLVVDEPASVLRRMLKGFPETVWLIIGGAIVENPQFANSMKYVLGQPYILERDFIPPILEVPEDMLFAWCHANPESAPAFVAQCAPFLSKGGDDTDDASLHPVMFRLLDEFGERYDVHRALESHIHPYHWIDSCADHYARLKKIFQQLGEHPTPVVRQWAEKMQRQVANSFRLETIRDMEREAQGRWIG
ncbi:MAG: type II toxin-antitoxin system MqsA family antitoxin [Bacteroidetes bacterium]|nr:type II toxin-antitoxin system MqsA family antitoxin [Bacteroidota bacterium]